MWNWRTEPTLTVEAPEFETVTASQVMPQRIDSTGSYALYTAIVEDGSWRKRSEGAYVSRTIDFTLTLPDRRDAADYSWSSTEVFNWDDFEEEEEVEYGGYVAQPPRRTTRASSGTSPEGAYSGHRRCGGLNSLPFELYQEAWGPELEVISAEPIVLEVCAISAEMAQYYERLDLINNPSGGPLFTEPVLAYSNVSSGYGCFGLYTSSTLSLSFE